MLTNRNAERSDMSFLGYFFGPGKEVSRLPAGTGELKI